MPHTSKSLPCKVCRNLVPSQAERELQLDELGFVLTFKSTKTQGAPSDGNTAARHAVLALMLFFGTCCPAWKGFTALPALSSQGHNCLERSPGHCLCAGQRVVKIQILGG